MPALKRCKTCGQEFVATAAQAYCRNPCLPVSLTERAAKVTECVDCGSEFKPRGGGDTRCRPCQAERKKPWTPSLKVCSGCGGTYMQQAPAQRYCKQECKPNFRPRLAPRACDGCGEEFQPINPAHRFCKGECNPANQPKGRTRKPLPTRTCEECGEIWHPSHEGVQSKLCFDCREAKRTHHAYARKKEWRAAVLSRAEQACEECGRSAGETGAPLHAHHVVPVSQGGLHTLDNGKALCVECHARTHDGAMGGASFQQPLSIVDQIAERVSAALVTELDEVKSRLAQLEELANRY